MSTINGSPLVEEYGSSSVSVSGTPATVPATINVPQYTFSPSISTPDQIKSLGKRYISTKKEASDTVNQKGILIFCICLVAFFLILGLFINGRSLMVHHSMNMLEAMTGPSSPMLELMAGTFVAGLASVSAIEIYTKFTRYNDGQIKSLIADYPEAFKILKKKLPKRFMTAVTNEIDVKEGMRIRYPVGSDVPIILSERIQALKDLLKTFETEEKDKSTAEQT